MSRALRAPGENAKLRRGYDANRYKDKYLAEIGFD